MGIKLKEIIEKKQTSFEELSGKVLVIDSFNIIYQFLSSVRQRDGTPLMDSKGRITSHLSGLFSRTAKMLEFGIKPVFVFDGKPPKLKEKEKKRRAEVKEEAEKQYKVALEREDVESMRKFGSRISYLTGEMIDESKELVKAMGIPIIQAPSEGEAQAAHLVNKGEAFAEVSQDYDCLLYGVKRFIQNLTVSERKKRPGALSFEKVVPEIISLEENLKKLGITQEQLIILGILVGTDYNIGGVKGIGPKHALKLVKEHGEDYDKIFSEAKWKESFEFGWKEVYDTIKKMPVTDDYELKWSDFNAEKIRKILVEEHDFSLERVNSTIGKLKAFKQKSSQKGLGEFV
ncbi:flap endonuclease-1 [Candidatus Woesearchaeota archaeon]|nr:flap endonuclease-1 [Candidatus Woesearchaeota archaeon]